MNKIRVMKLEEFATTHLSDKVTNLNEKDICESVNMFKPFVKKATEEEVLEAISNLEKRFSITMDKGSMLKEDQGKKWYFNARSQRGTKYWDRYYRYLKEVEKLPLQVIDKIDQSTDEIMDGLGDPTLKESFKRKGLVIGAVQSGKTSNYTALINKAADSGYKVIILLTGTIEKLRQQTQSRLDEGFVGFDSRIFDEEKQSSKIGVGLFDSDKKSYVSSFTTTARDFSPNNSLRLNSQKGVSILVLKKNKSVLEKLEKWLRKNNIEKENGIIDLPLLLIDDEADNASINTKDAESEPTTINKGIRNLLKLFSKHSYVGFTATPFANIFIDPEINENEKEDLFPKDFIYLLEQPSNYVGAMEMYSEDGNCHYMIKHNDDVEEVLPMQHKKETVPRQLPNSLRKAILLFFIANAVRDLRGDEKKDRSMLVHISRFISVQNSVTNLVQRFVNESKQEIKAYGQNEEDINILKEMHDIFDHEYGKKNKEKDFPIKESWESIKRQLYTSIDPIQVKTINSGNAANGLNYDEYPDGLRLIAIGGLSLARGLTLEGLMISYFYRNTKMYDTLMQMGRWFGYRDDYRDLCRLWTSKESESWYEHIAIATEELRREIKQMVAENKKPSDFGLRVRSAEDTPLIVTARNKMRTSKEVVMHVSLNGRMLETPYLFSDNEELEANNAAIDAWITDNRSYYLEDRKNYHLDKPLFASVPKEKVVSLLKELKFPYLNPLSEEIVKDIEKSDSAILDYWDIVIATTNKKNSEEDTINFGGLEIHPIERSFDFYGTKDFIRMSGGKRRLGSTNYATGGLECSNYRNIDERVKKQLGTRINKKGKKVQVSPTENMYFTTGIERRPLLVIYPVRLKVPTEPNEGFPIEHIELANGINSIITGISVGIPSVKDRKDIKYEYRINVIKERELLGLKNFSNTDYWEDPDEDGNFEND